MPQFFIHTSDIVDGEVLISGSDSQHLSRVRRVKQGTKIILRSDSGIGYLANVNHISQEGIRATIITELKTDDSIPEITVYMALLKAGNFEFVIQKTVELGVRRIVPVVTERTIPDPGKMNDKKQERWEKIAAEACKQCMRATPAFIDSPVSFKEILSEDIYGFKIICHPGAEVRMKDALAMSKNKDSISLLIGPEGGFSNREIADARDAGWIPANLGATHLRAETAALIIPSLVIYEWS